MYSEEEAEILRVLLDDLQKAFGIKSAKHAVKAAQQAYMRAARDRSDLERYRSSRMTIHGSVADDA